MTFFKRFNTVFYKLITSYILLVSFTTLLVGMISYVYFSSNFNNEIEKSNRKTLEHLSNIIDETVYKKVEGIYLSIVTDLFENSDYYTAFEQLETLEPVKIYNLSKYLTKVISVNSDIISSVHIYFNKNDVLVSSLFGLKYRDRHTNMFPVNIQWVDKLNNSDKSVLWIESEKLRGSDVLTYVKTYPFTSKKNNSTVCVAIDIKESAISNIIQLPESSKLGEVMMFGANGNIISRSNPGSNYVIEPDALFLEQMNSSVSNQENDFIENVNGLKSIVTVVTSANYRFKLVNITPVDQFYDRLGKIKQVILLICILTLLAGIFIANKFTSNIYNPLRDIMESAKKIFAPADLNSFVPKNEYEFINETLNNLSGKVLQLEETLDSNKPLIKHNLFEGLLNNRLKNRQELDEHIKLLNISMNMPFYRSIIIKLDSDVLDNISLQNSQFIKYKLINIIEGHSNTDITCYATMLSDYEISIITASRSDEKATIHELSNRIATYASTSFMLPVVLTVGNAVSDPMELYQSFKNAKLLTKYLYFMPEIKILSDVSILSRESSTNEFSDKIFDDFIKGLKARNIKSINEWLVSVEKLMSEGDYSADYCQQILLNIVSSFHLYVKDLNLNLRDINSNVYEDLKVIKNISQFRVWLSGIINTTFEYINQKNDNKNADVVDVVKNYVVNNLADPISLDSLADKVLLSPNYLSKIFKDETGMNFVDFVTEQRIKKAREIIVATDLTVEDISLKVGFNSSAYFIKKFKEIYGVTPRSYKQTFLRNAEN